MNPRGRLRLRRRPTRFSSTPDCVSGRRDSGRREIAADEIAADEFAPNCVSVRGHMTGADRFFSVHFLVFTTKIHVRRSQNRLRKKKFQSGYTHHRRTDLSSIWRLAGPTFGTRKRRYFRETRQNGVPDRTLQFS